MENDFRLDVDELASLDHAADADDRDQLAGEPDRRRADPRRHRADRRARASATTSSSSPTRSTAGSCTTATEHVSIASLPGMAERTIVLDGFSKTFAMTGWRLGYAIVPPWLVQTYGQLVINTISCAPTFAQVGAVEALRGPQDDVDAMVVEFRARRDLIVDGLNAIPGIRCLRPNGAFYAFPDISGTGLTGAELAERLLQEAGVCVLAGTAFGGVGHEPHPDLVRELAREPDARRCDRIRAFVDELPASPAPRSPRRVTATGRRSSSRGGSPTRASHPIEAAPTPTVWPDELPPPRDDAARRGRGLRRRS